MAKKKKKKLIWPTKDISYYERLINDSNVQAFLQTIRSAEGTAGELGYRTITGYGIFDDTTKHPDVYVPAMDSRAAGAYQFIYDTWHRIDTTLKFKDFGKHSQDIGAVFYLDYLTALDHIVNGNIDSAVAKASGTWVSLNGEKDDINKNIKPLDAILKMYENYGGTLHGPGHNLAPPAIPSKAVPTFLDTVNHNFSKYVVADNFNIPRPVVKDNPFDKKEEDIYDYIGGNSLLNLPRWITKGVDSNNVGYRKQLGPYMPGKKRTDIPQYQNTAPKNQFHPPLIKPQKKALTPNNGGNLFFDFTANSSPNVNSINKLSNLSDMSVDKMPASLGLIGEELSHRVSSTGGPDSGGNTNTIASRDHSRSVTVNLNTPMIGNFSVTTTDSAGIGDLKRQVEEVLFEVINSVSTA